MWGPRRSSARPRWLRGHRSRRGRLRCPQSLWLPGPPAPTWHHQYSPSWPTSPPFFSQPKPQPFWLLLPFPFWPSPPLPSLLLKPQPPLQLSPSWPFPPLPSFQLSPQPLSPPSPPSLSWTSPPLPSSLLAEHPAMPPHHPPRSTPQPSPPLSFSPLKMDSLWIPSLLPGASSQIQTAPSPPLVFSLLKTLPSPQPHPSVSWPCPTVPSSLVKPRPTPSPFWPSPHLLSSQVTVDAPVNSLSWPQASSLPFLSSPLKPQPPSQRSPS
mmetsp:Transcript_33700/g.73354  ORF Transcript_33700/g.73354 Transcript_33700/m.73354 type:complete len:267 (+) Transcript_33700:154-954(+)